MEQSVQVLPACFQGLIVRGLPLSPGYAKELSIKSDSSENIFSTKKDNHLE